MVSRVERGPVADWMRTADRWLIGSFIALMVIGLVMALAASPAVAERLNLSTFHFVNRQALMLIPTAALMIATSFLSPRHVRRAALLTFAVSFALIILALMFGAEVKGAQALDLRPAALGVHQAGVRRSRRLGFHRGRADRPDRDSGETPVLPAAAASPSCRSSSSPTSARRCWSRSCGRRSSSWPACIGSGWSPSGAWAWPAGSRSSNCRRTCTSACCAFSIPNSTGGMVDTFQVDTALQSILSGGWLGRGPRRGRLQAHPARRAHRLRFRRDRRGIRHDRLHGADRLLRLHRPARARLSRRAIPIRSAGSRPLGSRSCLACRAGSTWRSTCAPCRPRA